MQVLQGPGLCLLVPTAGILIFAECRSMLHAYDYLVGGQRGSDAGAQLRTSRSAANLQQRSHKTSLLMAVHVQAGRSASDS